MGLAKKLLIKSGHRGLVLNAPDGFSLASEDLPEDVEVLDTVSGTFDFVLLFAENQATLGALFPGVLSHLAPDAKLWVAYPKKSSKLKSDITRDTGWEVAKDAGYQGVSLISVDDTWSAFRLRQTL